MRIIAVWSSKSQFIIGLSPVLGLEKKLRWSVSLHCGGKVLPQLSPRNLGLRGSPVTFHTMKMFVDVGNHSNQSGANPCGRGCGKCSMSSKSQSISGSDLEPKKIYLLITSIILPWLVVLKLFSPQLSARMMMLHVLKQLLQFLCRSLATSPV